MLESDLLLVLGAALLTAVATGLGALPFVAFKTISPYWQSIANASAAGMMLAATHSLIAEGLALSPVHLLTGFLAGLSGILAAKSWIGGLATIQVAHLEGMNARRGLLLILVMTVHSFAEGVGVGVSFGGTTELALFITSAIALHNIPEGLAISLVLIPRGTPVWEAALWSIFTSLPQPLAALPSYIAVETFRALLPAGFGIAAGAMIWMVFAELIPEAEKNASASAAGTAVGLSLAALLALQYLVLKH